MHNFLLLYNNKKKEVKGNENKKQNYININYAI